MVYVRTGCFLALVGDITQQAKRESVYVHPYDVLL